MGIKILLDQKIYEIDRNQNWLTASIVFYSFIHLFQSGTGLVISL